MESKYYWDLIKTRDRLNFVSKQFYTAIFENDMTYVEMLAEEIEDLAEEAENLQRLFYEQIEKRNSEIKQIEYRLNQLQSEKDLGGAYALEIVLLKQRLAQLGVKIN